MKFAKIQQKNALRTSYCNIYAYAANNPVRYIDPDGRDVDATFEIHSYEETAYGWLARGTLTVTDKETGESISIPAYSGGIWHSEDGVSLPLPLGDYDILIQEARPDFFRLEALDSTYGNDIVDGIDIPQDHIRLHFNGATYGCLCVELEPDTKEYKQFFNFIKNNPLGNVPVESKYQNNFLKKLLQTEELLKYGTLHVVQSKQFIYHNQNAPEQYRQKFMHQRMK